MERLSEHTIPGKSPNLDKTEDRKTEEVIKPS
jgi:hypothetical protein